MISPSQNNESLKIVAYRIMENGQPIKRTDSWIFAVLYAWWYTRIEERAVWIEEYTVSEYPFRRSS